MARPKMCRQRSSAAGAAGRSPQGRLRSIADNYTGATTTNDCQTLNVHKWRVFCSARGRLMCPWSVTGELEEEKAVIPQCITRIKEAKNAFVEAA